jgi:four helix bundle protein
MDLVEEVYRLTATFPRQETYALANQMQRAAVSIPSNIAEGHVLESTAEYLRHLSIAQGSLAEVQTQVEISARLNYCTREEANCLLEQAASLARQLFALRNAIAKKLTPNSQLPTPNSRP